MCVVDLLGREEGRGRKRKRKRKATADITPTGYAKIKQSTRKIMLD